VTALFSRIVAAVDGSEASRDAVVLAARLACEHEGHLILCHAVNWLPPVAQLMSTGAIVDPAPMLDSLGIEGEALLDEAAGAARGLGVDPELRMVTGEPAECLVELAGKAKCRLIVMGTHGRHGLGRLALGSTAEAVLRLGTMPVLTVRAAESAPGTRRRCFERILVGIDDSEPSDAAIRTVLDFPGEDRSELMLYSVADQALAHGWAPRSVATIDLLRVEAQRIVDGAVAFARTRDVVAEGSVVDGAAAEALIAAARERRADLLVLGSHGRRGIQRFFLGSVAAAVVRAAPLPVLVVRAAN